VGDSYDSYRAAMRDPWHGWWIAWPPTQRVSLGDMFDTSGGIQRTAGNLAQQQITFGTSPGTPPASFAYDSQGSVTVRFKAAGSSPQGFSALTKADVGALVQFSSAESVLAVYGGLTQEDFSDARSVAADLARLHWDGRWPTELVAVSGVVTAATGLVITSTAAGASAELRLGAAASAGLSLADLAGQAGFSRSQHVGMQWSGTQVSPFYHVVGLRKDWLARIKTAYGPRQPGLGAAAEPIPPLVHDEAREDPDAVLDNPPQDARPPEQ
jgi:hypothetical protein